MIRYLHCTFRYKDELRVSPSVLDAAQAYEPLLSRSNIVKCNVSVFSPVILIPYERDSRAGKMRKMFNINKEEFFREIFSWSFDETKENARENACETAKLFTWALTLAFFSIACGVGGRGLPRRIIEINLCVYSSPFTSLSVRKWFSRKCWEMGKWNYSFSAEH